MNQVSKYPVFQALLAAVLFGASAPLAKLLLGRMEPVPLAAFLYLGSGFSLFLYGVLRSTGNQCAAIEAKLNKSDIPWLMGAVLSGGVAAPVVLMFSLRYTPAATASLLLNFEAAATTLMAAFVFKEAVGRRIWLAVICITAASIVLSFNFNGEWGVSLGALGILGACILWGLDNNFTRNVSTKDPVKIVAIKGLCAGSFSLILAIFLHNPMPSLTIVMGAMLLGCASYGLSIVLFIHAMRCLGASRASALFGIAPFVGMLLSLALFREMPGALFFISLPVMVTGVILLLNEKHNHEHVHAAIQHEHRHCHNDGHHTHDHAQSGLTPHCFHSHPHTHEVVKHLHPHTPDIHHRHVHQMNTV